MNNKGMSQRALALLVFLCILFLCLPAAALELSPDKITYAEPLTGISLGTGSLSLNVGESYTFPLTFEPESSSADFIKWYADESTVHIDPKSHTVTAIAPGTTTVLAESFDGFCSAVCSITVK